MPELFDSTVCTVTVQILRQSTCDFIIGISMSIRIGIASFVDHGTTFFSKSWSVLRVSVRMMDL